MKNKIKIYVFSFCIVILLCVTGCISNSLGASAPLPDEDAVIKGFTEIGVGNDGGTTINTADAKLVPIPLVTAINVSLVYSSSAVVEWETNIESDGYVEYGTSELYGMSSHVNESLQKKHRVQLQGLIPETAYSLRIVSSRYSLETAKSYSPNYNFTTESDK